MTSPASTSRVTVALALLLSVGCRGAEPSTSEPPPPAAAPEASTPTDPALPLEELQRLYDEAVGQPSRLKPVEAELERYLREHPDAPEALLLLAQVYLEQGEIDDSLATAERCVAVKAEEAGCWLTIGVISTEFREGAKDRALEGYRRYLELAPGGRYAPDVREALARLVPVVDASATLEKSTTPTGANADTIKTLITQRAPQLRICYERLLREHAQLTGKITYTVLFDPLGRVLEVTLDEDTVGDPTLAACTRAKVQGWRFPTLPGEGEGEVEVTFTVAYAPD